MTKEKIIQKLKEIESRLKKIEKSLEGYNLQEFTCNHQWENLEGTTAKMKQCKLCGKIEFLF